MNTKTEGIDVFDDIFAVEISPSFCTIKDNIKTNTLLMGKAFFMYEAFQETFIALMASQDLYFEGNLSVF